MKIRKSSQVLCALSVLVILISAANVFAGVPLDEVKNSRGREKKS
jgi:hypothetical protein